MRIWALALVAWVGGGARADITAPSAGPPAVPSVKTGSWCRDFYDAERARLGASKVSWGQATPKVVMNPSLLARGIDLRLQLPAGYQTRLAAEVTYWTSAGAKVEDPLRELGSGWSPIMVLYSADPGRPKALSFETIVPTMKVSGALYPATVTSLIRSTTVGDFPARELCAVVARSPGHATLIKGGHVPLPLTYDLVHGFELLSGVDAIGIIYRIEQSRLVEDEPQFGVVTAKKQ